MKKIILRVLVILLIFIFIFNICIAIKYSILNKIKNKAYEISEKQNIYIKWSDNFSYNIIRKSNTQKSKESQKSICVKFAENEIYTFLKENKMYLKSSNPYMLDEVDTDIKEICFFNEDFSNFFKQLKLCFKYQIKNEKFNNKNCYVLSTKVECNYIKNIYIDKDELTIIAITYSPKNINDKNPIMYEWNFNTVEEQFNKESMLNEYTNILETK